MKAIERKVSTDYKLTKTVKDTIVFHFTAGGTRDGAEQQLAKPDGVNVHYILDRDGQLYQYFPECFWAHHCGNAAWSKRSIALEIVNWGGLTNTSDGLWLPWTGKRNQAVPEANIFRTPLWRGYDAFEALTPAQKLALPEFVQFIMSRHPIRYLKTHADIVDHKTDFPPNSFVYDIIGQFLDNMEIHTIPKQPETIHMEFDMSNKQAIQDRINWLIKNKGWQNAELKYLISVRDKRG